LKTRIFEGLKERKTRGVFIVGIVANLAMIILYFVLINSATLRDTLFSVLVGITYVNTLIVNFCIIFVGAGYYTHKDPANFHQRLVVEIASLAYILLLPVSVVIISRAGLHQAGVNSLLNILKLEGLFTNDAMIYCIQNAIAILLALFVWRKGKPSYDLYANGAPRYPESKRAIFWLSERVPRMIVQLLLLVLIIASFDVVLRALLYPW
jgi:hypothetical protein